MRALTLCGVVALVAPLAALQEAREAPGDDFAAASKRWARGLAALVEQQDAQSGAWRGDVGFKLNSSWRVTAADVPHVGVTGLAVEALVVAGIRPGEGPYGEALARGAAFLLSAQDETGYLTAHGSRMRSHAYALRALARLATVAPGPAVRDAVRRGAAFGVNAQAEGGGWRFVPRSPERDVLETTYQLDALRQALAPLRADPEDGPALEVAVAAASAISRARDHVRTTWIRDPEDGSLGGFRFQDSPNARVTANTTAAGMLALGGQLLEDRALAGRTLARWAGLVAERRAAPERWAGHFLAWDADLLEVRALATLAADAPDLVDPALLESAAAARRAWLALAEAPDGGWRSTQGPGDSYATAIGCLLLAGG